VDARPRLPIGQLLGRLLHSFRQELHRRAQEGGYTDIREAHLQVFGAIDWTGTRLTDLASRANMTLPAMSELVDELQRCGYLERRPDPSDRRAKLIVPTRKGRRVLVAALRAVREIEARYAAVVGEERFHEMVEALQDLVGVSGDSWQPRTSRLSRAPSVAAGPRATAITPTPPAPRPPGAPVRR
jgi:DNA-binding MarR family transcriptional regulator